MSFKYLCYYFFCKTGQCFSPLMQRNPAWAPGSEQLKVAVRLYVRTYLVYMHTVCTK